MQVSCMVGINSLILEMKKPILSEFQCLVHDDKTMKTSGIWTQVNLVPRPGHMEPKIPFIDISINIKCFDISGLFVSINFFL